jgi:NAD(P)-dependent dehydrogenase (short-subunit alcohol dehydrogenase family)
VFAEHALRAGARVAIADILEEQGRETAASLSVPFVGLDLADPVSVEKCADEAVRALGGLDGLINNAAIATGIGGKSLSEIDIETWDKVMTVNVRGPWLMVKACLPHLKKSRRGKILNIASDTAMWGAPKLMHYVASKGAVISMTRSMARELGEFGIAVNALAPGLTVGEATEYVPKERHDQYVAGRALSREQTAEDVVGPALFLLSDGADFTTGQILPVNGGFVLN